MQTVWETGKKSIKTTALPGLRTWLFQVNNLTQALRQNTMDYVFEPIEINVQKPFNPTEVAVLDSQQGCLRRIAHQVSGRRVVYARVAIPEATYVLMQKALGDLDAQPIGPTLLYGNPSVRRGDLRCRCIEATETGFADAFTSLGSPKRLWARYSLFYWYGRPFMITEFFLPNALPIIKVPLSNRIGFYRGKEKCLDYIRLIRLHRPIPILLILWPVYWALWIAARGFPGWKIFIIFTVGAFLMRSAGDIFNDIADRHLDSSVERTKIRPLTTKRLSVKSAVVFAMLLCLFAFFLVLMLNKLTILLSFLVLGLACVYPWMKRVTYWPQFVLGMAYNSGVIMAFAAVQNQVPAIAWFIWGLTVIWTIAYDTLYALADRRYDIKTGIKSTAVRFGRYAETMIGILDGIFLVGIAMILSWLGFSSGSLLGLLLCIPFFIYQLRLIKGYRIQDCIKAFGNNHWVGLIILIIVLCHYHGRGG